MTDPGAERQGHPKLANATAAAEAADREYRSAVEASLRIARDLSKVGIELTVVLTSAIQGRYPGPLEEGVDALAKFMREPSERVWMLLRSDNAVRMPPGTDRLRSQGRQFEMILLACDRADQVPHVRRLVRKIRILMEEREQINAARNRAVHQRKELVSGTEEMRSTGGPQPAPPRVMPDLPGHDHHKPDPLTATSVVEFVEMLGQLHVWAGEPSLRELARRCEGQIAHSTLSAMLNNPHRLPTQTTVTLFVRALGCDDDDVRAWVTAWREIRFKKRACPKPHPTVLQMPR